MELNNKIVIEKISELAKEKWKNSRNIILISQLGASLGDEYRKFMAQSEGSVKKYIISHSGEGFRYIPFKSKGGAIAPKAEVESLSDEDLEACYGSKLDELSGEKVPLYLRDVWFAFQSVIDGGDKRFVCFSPDGPPKILSQRECPDKKYEFYEILESDLVLDKEKLSINKKIQNWAARNSINLSRITRVARGGGKTITNEAVGSGQAVFINFFSMISKEDLRRINIPADIVLSVMERISLK